MDKNIIWLASYPKSGNTWFRAFLVALQNQKELDINKIKTNGIFSGKDLMENTLDLSSDYITEHQLEEFQRVAYRYASDKAKKPMYVKIHDAFTFSEFDKKPLVPEGCTKVAIYLIRNPLDVTLSLANHNGKSIDKTIEKFICNENGAFVKNKKNAGPQFHQPLGTWSMHVESWLTKPSFKVHFMKYEDMKAKPFETFKNAVLAMGLNYSDTEIERAIDEVEFEKLRAKELEKGFKENQNLKSTFFFKGQVGRWKEELSQTQIEKIINANEKMMRHFGYI